MPSAFSIRHPAFSPRDASGLSARAWRGLPVTVMGLGHFGGGVAAARWLARQGARVTVTDLAAADALADALEALAGVPLAALHLGGHREDDFRRAVVLVVNPAVRPGNPFVQLAQQGGARITSEIELFIESCPARLIGVTGSNGKSTTTAMTAAILQAAGRKTWLGGNLGGSLLDRLDEITADDWAVLELSSFQLWRLGPAARGPDVAVVTNCVPNHLNWHPDFAHYAAAKQRIFTLQSPGDAAVLNPLDPEVARWRPLVRGRLLPPLPLEGDRPEMPSLPPLLVPGQHNRHNAALAGAAAAAAGCDARAIRRGLETFAGLPQRLELLAQVGRRRFYNDSAATTPESTIAALQALSGPLWLLAGGSDKGADFEPLLAAIACRAAGVAFYGAVAPRLAAQLASHLAARAPAFRLHATATLAEALAWCWAQSAPGDAILLSPACASHDQFTNYQHRGQHFAELALGMLNAEC